MARSLDLSFVRQARHELRIAHPKTSGLRRVREYLKRKKGDVAEDMLSAIEEEMTKIREYSGERPFNDANRVLDWWFDQRPKKWLEWERDANYLIRAEISVLPAIGEYVREKGNINLATKNWDELRNEIAVWQREMEAKELQKNDDSEIVHKFGNGWTIRQLSSEESCRYEGTSMGNCSGSEEAQNAIYSGYSSLYSLRDPKNIPHVTMEVDPNNLEIVQAEGKGGRDTEIKEEYEEMIVTWAREKGLSWNLTDEAIYPGQYAEQREEEERQEELIQEYNRLPSTFTAEYDDYRSLQYDPEDMVDYDDYQRKRELAEELDEEEPHVEVEIDTANIMAQIIELADTNLYDAEQAIYNLDAINYHHGNGNNDLGEEWLDAEWDNIVYNFEQETAGKSREQKEQIWQTEYAADADTRGVMNLVNTLIQEVRPPYMEAPDPMQTSLFDADHLWQTDPVGPLPYDDVNWDNWQMHPKVWSSVHENLTS